LNYSKDFGLFRFQVNGFYPQIKTFSVLIFLSSDAILEGGMDGSHCSIPEIAGNHQIEAEGTNMESTAWDAKNNLGKCLRYGGSAGGCLALPGTRMRTLPETEVNLASR
jgi:hypothetical protein